MAGISLLVTTEVAGISAARRHRVAIILSVLSVTKLDKPSPSRQRMLQAGTAVARMGLNGRDHGLQLLVTRQALQTFLERSGRLSV